MKKIFYCIVILIVFQIIQMIQISLCFNPNINIPKDARYLCYVDFKKLSCFDRFYIYDIKKNKVIYSARVQHGIGRNSTIFKPKFSNEIGSNCSSLGLFKVSCLSKMHSSGVECFRLKGLSNTNSNAEKRGILIHSGFGVSLIPSGIPLPVSPESKGCFTVSIITMQILKYCLNKGNIYIYSN